MKNPKQKENIRTKSKPVLVSKELMDVLMDLEKVSKWQKAYWKRVIDRESINNLRA